MQILYGIVLFVLAWFGLGYVLEEPSVSLKEARDRYPSDVARHFRRAQRAERPGAPADVLLAIAEKESGGEKRLFYHPDGVSWGIMGLTQNALDAIDSPARLSENAQSITPQAQFDIAAEYLQKRTKAEGSLFEGVKWYNHGKKGGRGYAVDVFTKAGREGQIPPASPGGSKGKPKGKDESKQTDNDGSKDPIESPVEPVDPLPGPPVDPIDPDPIDTDPIDPGPILDPAPPNEDDEPDEPLEPRGPQTGDDRGGENIGAAGGTDAAASGFANVRTRIEIERGSGYSGERFGYTLEADEILSSEQLGDADSVMGNEAEGRVSAGKDVYYVDGDWEVRGADALDVTSTEESAQTSPDPPDDDPIIGPGLPPPVDPITDPEPDPPDPTMPGEDEPVASPPDDDGDKAPIPGITPIGGPGGGPPFGRLPV